MDNHDRTGSGAAHFIEPADEIVKASYDMGIRVHAGPISRGIALAADLIPADDAILITMVTDTVEGSDVDNIGVLALGKEKPRWGAMFACWHSLGLFLAADPDMNPRSEPAQILLHALAVIEERFSKFKDRRDDQVPS